VVTDYSEGCLAEQYQQWFTAYPLMAAFEAYSFLKLIGDVKGKRVLDVGCGDGHYTRMLRKAGAAEVVGIDISDRMIELAREQEACQSLGIEYRVEDARIVVGQPNFDLVVSAFLLGHARTRAELAQMCRMLASRVSPGGRCVNITTNPGVSDFDSAPNYRKYGYGFSLPDQFVDGAPIRFTLLLEDSRPDLVDYYLPIEAYESAFTQAGFRDFALHMLEPLPAPDEPAYWDDFLRRPAFILMDCVKFSEP
jgi:toxoflavin synthase